MSTDDRVRPENGAAILSRATRCAAFEALARTGEPASALCLLELLGRDRDLPAVVHHVRRLADAGPVSDPTRMFSKG